MKIDINIYYINKQNIKMQNIYKQKYIVLSIISIYRIYNGWRFTKHNCYR